MKAPVVLGEFETPQAMDETMRLAKLVGQAIGQPITFSTKHVLMGHVGPKVSGKTRTVATDHGPNYCKTHDRDFPSKQALGTHRARAHKK